MTITKDYIEYLNRIRQPLPKMSAKYSAEDCIFDPTIIGILTSTNVQDAIDELTGASLQFQVELAANTPINSLFKYNALMQAEIVTSLDSSLDMNEIVGMTLVAGNALDIVDAIKDNSVVTNAAWTLTPNGNIYLDSTGQITQTVPTSGQYIPLGYAISATKIWFKVGGQYRPENVILEVGVNVTAGMYVNIYDAGGTAKVRPAEAFVASVIKPADGYVIDTVAAGGFVMVYLEGINPQLVGLTIGQRYVLGASGAVLPIITPPTNVGDIIQHIGTAYTATNILNKISQDYITV